MRKIRRLAMLALILVASHAFAPPAAAHPLGNFTINHYAGLHITQDRISIDYLLDMAEIPAFQEIAAIDQDGDGVVGLVESARYHPGKCEAIGSDLVLRVNGQPVPVNLSTSALDFPPGQGGLATLRLSCEFWAELALAGKAVQVEFEDESYANRLGWREIVLTGEGVSLQGDFATTSLSNRLVEYPEDLLESPLDQRKISFVVDPQFSAFSTGVQDNRTSSKSPAVDRNDAFTRLIQLDEFTLPAILLALMISFIWGALHALTPGHGKTIVGAYLVGTRGTARHALYLGLTTTVTHTAGVFVLGLLTLFASQYILAERLFPWLNLISGLLVVGIGVNLFLTRLHGARTPQLVLAHPENHAHGHEHHPSHDGDHNHAHVHGHSHDHLQDHVHEQEHSHARGKGGHSHLPPGADGAPVTWRSLLALGISGGLLPCPSALVVMLSAIALGRTGFGLVLVLVFSLGLAGVLTAIGLLFIYASRYFDRYPAQGRVIRILPAASALVIAVIGAGITAQAILALGILNL